MQPEEFTDKERERMVQELRRSGYPLEYRVAMTCQAAIDGPTPKEGGTFRWREHQLYRIEEDETETHIPLPYRRYPFWNGGDGGWSSQRLIYRAEGAASDGRTGTWRDVDRLLEYETYVDPQSGPEDATIMLHAQALIECKHREDVVLVGFPDPDRRPTAFPMLGTMAPTRMIRAAGHGIAQPCAAFPHVTLGGLERKGSGWHAAKEELGYKSTGALYDYLVTEWTPWAEGEVHPFLREVGIWQELERLLASPYFYPSGWIHNELKPEWCAQFNAEHVAWNVIPAFKLVLPIICVDMPLLVATMDAHGQITDLTPTPGMVVEERIHSWPGPVDHVRYTEHPRWMEMPGAAAVVVHVDHLMDVLVELAEWANNWYFAMSHGNLDEALVTAWPLEQAIWKAVASVRDRRE